ncbi:MAG: phosphonate metabolism protein/1,5-bisphosphokinase (PRPP-forming) PhnN [Paracoccaceae bacterium]
MTGRLFLVVGPSGAGKDTLLAGAKAANPVLHWARRVITRPETVGGEPFEGVSAEEFQARLLAGDFALHWQAHGLRYGVPFTETAALKQGHDVLVNGSRGAIPAALAAFPDLTVIRICAPAAILAERLAARGRESHADIKARLDRADYDLPIGVDVIDIHNDSSPAEGIARLLQALSA